MNKVSYTDNDIIDELQLRRHRQNSMLPKTTLSLGGIRFPSAIRQLGRIVNPANPNAE